jgi:H+/Cl- antiporter ClcA
MFAVLGMTALTAGISAAFVAAMVKVTGMNDGS